MSVIHLDNSYLPSHPPLSAGPGNQPTSSNGVPIHGDTAGGDTQRGPDTIVQISPQATEAAADDANRSANDTQTDSDQRQDPNGNDAHSEPKSSSGKPLTDEQKQQLDQLKQRDQEVRRHEQAHKASAGQLAKGSPAYTYQTGPDGKQYAVGGEVQIDTSPVEGDPEATIRKMETVQRAAEAPAHPSSQDRAVAAQAASTAQKARQELQKQDTPESDQRVDAGQKQTASESNSTEDFVGTTVAHPGLISPESIQDAPDLASPSGDRFVTPPVAAGHLLDVHA